MVGFCIDVTQQYCIMQLKKNPRYKGRKGTIRAYLSQIRDQKHFTILPLVADWHELMILQHIMQPTNLSIYCPVPVPVKLSKQIKCVIFCSNVLKQ